MVAWPCVTDWISRAALATPEGVAVMFGEAELRYRDLDAQANRLAHALRARGVGRGSRVAICLERSLDLVIAMLGARKAGADFDFFDLDMFSRGTPHAAFSLLRETSPCPSSPMPRPATEHR